MVNFVSKELLSPEQRQIMDNISDETIDSVQAIAKDKLIYEK